MDEDNDYVTMSSNDDVFDAVRIAQQQGQSKVVLYVQENKDKKSQQKYRPNKVNNDDDDDDDDDDGSCDDETLVEKKTKRKFKDSNKPASVNLMVSGAVLFATVVGLGVFVLSKPSR